MTVREVDFIKQYKTVFGSYVDVSEDETVTNKMMPKTFACIALGPSGNLQVSQKVFDIYTKMILKLRSIKEFTVPDRVVRQMNYLGKSPRATFWKKLKISYRTKAKYDWDNDELEDI